jgi:hypothetical protein
MSPIAEMLLEYFVVGAVAALWALPLVLTMAETHSALAKDLAPIFIAALIPALYVVGMVCDLIGQKLTHPFKEVIEQQVRKKLDEPEASSQAIHALSVALEPALAKEIDERSVRDRIARGSLAALLPVMVYWPYTTDRPALAHIIGFGVVVALAMLWFRMQKLSSSYEFQVLKVLRAKYPDKIPDALSRKPTTSAA